jgi:hypothetical protein
MYSRENPSPRYRELTQLYRQMHAEGEQFLKIPPEQTFPGLSLPSQAGRIKRLVSATGAANILDYGSGKGMQYDLRGIKAEDGNVYDSIQDYWDVDFIQCYDPSFTPFSKLPAGKFDGVISTDVLEHCPEEDLRWIIEEIFSFADKFVFANVACYPAKKRLPTGENAHCTIQPPEWWKALIAAIAARHPGVAWEFWIQWREDAPGGPRLLETRLSSEDS